LAEEEASILGSCTALDVALLWLKEVLLCLMKVLLCLLTADTGRLSRVSMLVAATFLATAPSDAAPLELESAELSQSKEREETVSERGRAGAGSGGINANLRCDRGLPVFVG
jgi:hypothetical protein